MSDSQETSASSPDGQAVYELVAAVLSEIAPSVSLDDCEKVDEGQMNTTFLYPGGVLKIAKEGYQGLTLNVTRAALRGEAVRVRLLTSGLDNTDIQLPVETPRVIAADPEGAWLALKAYGGHVYSRQEIRRFSAEELKELGRTVGTFTLGTSQAVDIRTLRQQIGDEQGVIDKPAQFREVLGKLSMFEAMGYANLVELLRSYVDEYDFAHDFLRQERGLSLIFTHRDLHQGNMSFIGPDGQRKLKEIFDWALAGAGTAAHNFRYLALLSPVALRAALDYWREKTDEDISEELVIACAGLHFAISCARSIDITVTGQTINPIAAGNVELLHPQYTWGSELSRVVPARP
ncbi:MAG TPA: phosphotransferase [Verrucomicrobiae bacterium]|nr:phosphotransferase [Verrucomicrobiae bacterium]